MSTALNLYRNNRGISSILPCASLPGGCQFHETGRNQPCLDKSSDNGEGSKLRTRVSTFFQNRTIANKIPPPHLFSLPVELLQEIASYLADSELIAFSVTCSALFNTFGNSGWAGLRARNRKEFLHLLGLLQRDRRHWRLCCKCDTLHSPRFSTISFPPNVLTRAGESSLWMRFTIVYVLEPYCRGSKGLRRPLYWISREHIRLAISGNICLATLSCSGQKTYERLGRAGMKMNFKYTISPLMVRRNILWHADYEVSFETDDHRVCSLREALEHLDFRCCMHCTNGSMTPEIEYLMRRRRDPNSRHLEEDGHAFIQWQRGCNRHSKEGCACAVDYVVNLLGTGLTAFRVRVWQWFGEKSTDWVLRQPGILRNMYEEAKLDAIAI
ncbi:hypothetical protein K432DRAFT_384971 [Lepidopterella palustris CBS 459.81]|uniref:F-box domain-containing protein n=1 Tax=Lepidopterella palustris CBS 459.81 TaxID=1314670 RepID=A0A8E2E458_9PEZI|nr:hypothetical protein K432DRAFT_384971 [Lepidopterella palustris CBS 459.81]